MIFLLNFMPDWIFYAMTLTGFIAIFVIMVFGVIIPLPYKLVLQLLSIFLLVSGTFFIGGISNQAEWQLKVKQMETEIAKKELEAEKISHEVVTKYIDRVKIVEGKTHEIIKKVPVYITKESDDKCIINNGFVSMFNASANQTDIPITSKDINEGASDVKLSEVATVVSQNNGTYYQVAEQLKSLQEWIIKQKDLSND
jgi:hypothetical protein